MAAQVQATFWYILPSRPMFHVITAPLRGGVGVWPAPGLGCVLTIARYGATLALAPPLGIALKNRSCT